MEYFKVGDNFRTNNLSNTPGGVTIIIEFKPDANKHVKRLEYDKVKNPETFIKAAMSNNSNISRAWIKKQV